MFGQQQLRICRSEQRLCAGLRHQRHEHSCAGAAAAALQVCTHTHTYARRHVRRHVSRGALAGCRCPVASLCYVPHSASRTFPCGGLIAGSLEGGCFWEQVNETTYRPHVLPLEAAGCVDIQVEADSRHCLVTYRPGQLLNMSL